MQPLREWIEDKIRDEVGAALNFSRGYKKGESDGIWVGLNMVLREVEKRDAEQWQRNRVGSSRLTIEGGK